MRPCRQRLGAHSEVMTQRRGRHQVARGSRKWACCSRCHVRRQDTLVTQYGDEVCTGCWNLRSDVADDLLEELVGG